MQMQIQKYGNQISEISNKATMEHNIENVRVIQYLMLKIINI